jgi:hypothetical protein
LLVVSALLATPDSRLSEARLLADEFQYDKATRTAEAALQLSDITRETLVGLYEVLGTAHATLDRPGRARDAFVKLLVIAPEHHLSKNQPPRIRTPYFEARTEAARLGALAIVSEPATRVDRRVTELSVRVQDNPLFPARAVRFSVQEDGAPVRVERVPVTPAKTAALKVDGKAIKWSAELLGERGIVLEVLEREEQPLPELIAAVEAPPQPAPPPPTLPAPTAEAAQPTAWVRPFGIVVGAVGLAALGTGAAFGFLSADARSKVDHAASDAGVVTGLTQKQAAALDHQARTDALVADILFVAGGVLVGTGLGLLVFGPKAPPPVTFVVGPVGVGVFARF